MKLSGLPKTYEALTPVEFSSRAHESLRVIHARLAAIGYRFSSPDDALREAKDEDRRALAAFERAHGALPLVIRAWYERIASVDFRQDTEQMNDESAEGLGRFGNGAFVVQSLERAVGDEAYPSFFALGATASNCDSIGFVLGSEKGERPHSDARTHDVPVTEGGTTFCQYVWDSVACGGLPWLREVVHDGGIPPFLAPVNPNIAALYARLTEGFGP